MMRHADIWRAIDGLARDHGLSVSGLARAAGLDPTTFNKSKRATREGKARWPSTESVAKVLEATGASLDTFVGYVRGEAGGAAVRTVPVIGFAQAGAAGYFDDAGYPAGGGWDEIRFPDLGDPHAYAVEVAGDSMQPVYRDGDRLIVSPASSLRKGDRVVVKTRDGEVMVKELLRQTANRLDLRSLNPSFPDRRLDLAEIDWVARVLWVSQ
jgi:phage repressor protein C with HTH and peptisase S24 domain